MIAVGLLAVAGLFAGGAYSMYTQGSRVAAVVLGALAAVAGTAGMLWLV